MSRVIFKMKFQHPNLKNTKMNNMYHLLYIGTREGVALNDDIKEMNNETLNDDYLKYIANRPRSHGLFSNGNNIDIQKVANEMKEYQGYVYRGIISLREDDAVKLGYDNKEKWERLIRDRMHFISQELNIPYSRLGWVGAFHREKGHPHVHLMMWNKVDSFRSRGVVPQKNIEYIRKNLTNNIFKEEREQILLEKNSLRDLLIEGSKGIQNNDFNKYDKLIEAYKEIDVDLLSEVEELNDYEIGEKVKNVTVDKIKDMVEQLEVPRNGRLQYKLMSPDVKKEIDKITNEILNTPSYKIYYEKYINSIEELTKLYTDKPEDIESAKENGKNDIYSRIGNSILKTKREMIFNARNENNTNKNNYNSNIQSMLFNVFKTLTANTNKNNNSIKSISKSKEQRKAYAKKMIAKGLYSDKDIENEY